MKKTVPASTEPVTANVRLPSINSLKLSNLIFICAGISNQVNLCNNTINKNRNMMEPIKRTDDPNTGLSSTTLMTEKTAKTKRIVIIGKLNFKKPR